MFIWRGMGILSPIVFVIIYFTLYWFCGLFTSPQPDKGWFIFFGAIMAGIITNLFGKAFNADTKQVHQGTPSQVFYSHSFFFIPMQYSGFLFAILLIFFGVNNTNKNKRNSEFLNKGVDERAFIFEQKRRLKDSIIYYPSVGDFYILEAEKNTNHRISTTTIPLKIIEFNDTEIEFLCPFKPTYDSDNKIKNYNHKNIEDVFNNTNSSFTISIKKSVLLGAKTQKDRTIKKAYLPDLLKEGSIRLVDIWRIHVPFFLIDRKEWNKKKVDISIKNIGTPTTIKEVIFSGNKINWNPNQEKIDFKYPEKIKKGDRLRLQSYQIENTETKTIKIICTDEQHQFLLHKEKNDLWIEKIRVPIAKYKIELEEH